MSFGKRKTREKYMGLSGVERSNERCRYKELKTLIGLKKNKLDKERKHGVQD